MMSKILTAAAAGLFALSSVAIAQSTGTPGASGSSGSGASGAAGASTDIPSKCVSLTGAEREKCVQDARSGAGAGASGSSSTSGGMGGSSSGSSTSPSPTPAPSPTTPGSDTKKQ